MGRRRILAAIKIYKHLTCGLLLISLVCSVSLRPDGTEEHRQHLLHERCPPGPVQLVRPLLTCLPSPLSTCLTCLRALWHFFMLLFTHSSLSLRTFNMLLFSSHLLFYSLSAWSLLTVKKGLSENCCSAAFELAEVALCGSLWGLLLQMNTNSFPISSVLSSPLFLFFSHHYVSPLLFLFQSAAFFMAYWIANPSDSFFMVGLLVWSLKLVCYFFTLFLLLFILFFMKQQSTANPFLLCNTIFPGAGTFLN